MSMFDWLFGVSSGVEYPPDSPWNPQQGQQAPQMAPSEMKYVMQALALHPDANEYFNLQPTIDMLKTADLYGFEVRRKPVQLTADRSADNQTGKQP